MSTASTSIATDAQLRPGYIYGTNFGVSFESQGVAIAPDRTSTVLCQYLTDDDHHVTVLPQSNPFFSKQLWRVTPGKKGNTIIGRPSDKRPTPSLTFAGAKEAEEGDKIVSDFPPSEWYLEPATKGSAPPNQSWLLGFLHLTYSHHFNCEK